MSDSRTPEEIRSEIESTREELADTAAALAYKTDVKARVDDRKEEVKANFHAKVDETKAAVTGKVDGVKSSASNATPEGAKSTLSSASQQATSTVKANPVPTAAIAAAVLGFALGYLVARR